MLWSGIAIICLGSLTKYQYIGLISTVFVYLLLTRVSGINLLEQYADKKCGNLKSYQEYKRKTPKLFF